jgi:oligosaccharide repeat unit polymerase
MKESLLMALWAGFLFVSLAITARLLKRSWLAPGAFFALYWCGAAVSPLVFSSYEEVSFGAVIWIFLSTLTVLVGDLVGAVGSPNKQLVTGNFIFSTSQISFVATVIIFCSFVGIVSLAIILISAGENLSFLFSVQDFLAVARKIADSRYTRTYKPFLSQFLNMFLYAGPLFGGLLAAIEHRRRYLIIAALPMLPALLMTAIFTIRGFIIISILLWISSYLAAGVLLGRYQLFTKRHLISGLLVLVLLSIIVIRVGFARRGFTYAGSIAARSYAQVCTVAFGHMAVFSNWFERRGLENNSPLPGAHTFAGVFDLLGIRNREVGLFTEFVTLSNGISSNIYTIFRVLIEDFTPLGSLVVLFLIAFLASHVYERLPQGRVRAMPILVAFYASVLWSSVTCIWIWNSVIAAFVLFTIGFLIMLELPNLRALSNSLFSHLGTWYSTRNKLKR